MCVPSASGVSQIAVCPPSPIADDPSALPSPTSSPSSSQSLFLPVHSMPALYASCCTVLLYFPRDCTVRLKMFYLFFCVCFLCIICVKSIVNLLQYSTIEPMVLVGYLGKLCWTYEQIGLTNSLSERNSFVCRGLTVLGGTRDTGGAVQVVWTPGHWPMFLTSARPSSHRSCPKSGSTEGP